MQISDDDFKGRQVLIIEDDALVAMLLQDMLTDIGFEVVGTIDQYAEAFEKAKSMAFDVAILDVSLNGPHTFQIAEAIADRGIAFLFSTGYNSGILPLSLRHVPLLQKPFQQSNLKQALRAALAMVRQG